MKIQLASKKNLGSILLVCLGGAFIIGIGLVSVLYMVMSENTVVSRAQAWNNALVIAEAGVEEGMTLVNKNVTTANSVMSWNSSAAADGWASSGSVYSLTRYLGAGYYKVWVTNNSTTVTIKSTGVVLWTNGPVTPISRAILVTANISSSFLGPITVKHSVVLSGGAIVDSFDSSSSLYSSNGFYAFNKHKADGNILAGVSNAPSATDLDFSSGNIYGRVSTANNTLKISGSATIGDTNYAGPGIESGWTNGNANVTIPDAPPVPTPPYGWTAMPPVTNNVVILDGGGAGHVNYYQMTSGNFNNNYNGVILIRHGTVVLDDEQSNFQMSGGGAIVVTNGASLQIWVNGAAITLSGGGTVNLTGNATNCTLYGTANCTAITYSGSSTFVGTMDAPYADMTWSGGSAVVGAVIGNSLTDSGGSAFHYDEILMGGYSGAYVLAGWNENLALTGGPVESRAV